MRCGACLLVFAAAEHLVEPPPEVDADEDVGEDGETADHEDPEDQLETLDDKADIDQDEAAEDFDDIDLDEYEDDIGDIDIDEYQDDIDDIDIHDEPEETMPAGFRDNIVVDRDPQEIVGTGGSVRKRASLWWPVGSLVLLIVLGAQYLWVQRDILAQMPEYRPWYVTACTWLGCEAPAYRDLSALATASLVVRSHPQAAQALMVDALLRNEAPFRQRFPPLDLKFTNTRNEVVAARRFAPEEYLRGELTGLKFIPARTEVRLSLEIVDPGEEALGYSLTVAEHW